MTRLFIGLAVGMISLSSAANAEHPTVVGPLPGYGCMVLNLTEQQSMDPSTHVPVRGGPSDTAPVSGYASGIMVVPMPLRSKNGFTQVLFGSGTILWIQSSMLRPYYSLGDPAAKCRAVRLSNGKPSFDTYH